MHNPLRRLTTIAAKLTWLVGVVSGVAVLIVSGWSGVRSYRHLQQQSVETVVSQARVVATYSSAAFAFGDKEIAEESLQALRVVQGMQRAYLLDQQGRVFAAFTPGGTTPSPIPAYPIGQWPVRNGFVFVTPVEDRAGVHGRLQVEVRNSGLRREAFLGALHTGLLTIAAMGFALWLARQLHPLLTGPVVRLERAAQRVRDTGDYSTRVAIESDDELGRLGEAFNEMLSRIEGKELELVGAQRRTQESKEQLELATEAAEIGLWDVDLVANTLYWPPRVKAMFGIAADQPVAMEDFYHGVHPDDREQVAAAFATAMDPGLRAVYDAEYRTLGRDDRLIRWVAAKGRGVFDEDGTCLRVIGTAIDITKRKANEQALRASEEQLRAADRRKDEFLAMLAHELRNPLAPIAMAGAILERADGDPVRVKSASQVIGRQVRHMSALIDDLLDVSRVTRGLIDIEQKEVQLESVIHSALEQALPLLDARGHTLVSNVADSATWVRGDRTRLVQSVVNLLNNAAKYTPPGGRVTVGLAAGEGSATISVSDTGIGVDHELLPHIFDLFVQGERTQDRAQGGLGIGLALVRALVGLHDGTVSAASDGTGTGSHFSITIPTLELASTETQSAQVSPQASKALRVLIVDDNHDAADSLVHWLSLIGHQTCVAYSGGEALHAASAHAFDAYILDIGLPDMTGHELLGLIRSRTEVAGGLFIAATGYGQQHDRAASAKAGFHHHLVKPIDPSGILELLQHHMTAKTV